MPNAQEWVLRRRTPDDFLADHPDLDPLVARVLYARHIDTPDAIREFLSTDGSLGDPLLLADMDHALERIRRAVETQEQIAVYGDFDVDGVTATVLLTSVLRALRARVQSFIPDRFEDGYGLNIDALDRLQSGGVTLCVTVDCGVRSNVEVAHAQAHGLDMVITDHHSVPDVLPEAIAVIDPRRTDSDYAFRELAGVGVAFQVSQALVAAMSDTERGRAAASAMDAYLDLVALGTIADVVPLEGENRTLARWGLNRLRSAPRPGLQELARVAGIELTGINSTDVAFRIAPRLNAAGRIENARIAYQLLNAATLDEAAPLAKSLDEKNRERQQLLEKQLAEASAGIDAESPPLLLFVEGPDYHEGIVGLVASRLRELFYRPALVLRRGPDTARGSARSIEGFHITEALESCRDILVRFGGHAQAAGFTLESVQIAPFRDRLLAYADEHLDTATLTPRLMVDAIVGLADLAYEPNRGRNTPAALATLGPFGKGNPEPLLATLGANVTDLRRIGSEGKHLRLDIVQNGTPCSCVAFRQGDVADWLNAGDRIDLVYRPGLNRWQGRESLQLVIEAVRPHQANGA
ncbi:MAG: single-stranded-DNA-specific exonuclease RecJ [Anaerolineae bacterium]